MAVGLRVKVQTFKSIQIPDLRLRDLFVQPDNAQFAAFKTHIQAWRGNQAETQSPVQLGH